MKKKTLTEFRQTYYRGKAGSVAKIESSRKYGFFGPETAHYVAYHPRTGSAFHTTNARRAKSYAKYGHKSFRWERKRNVNESMGLVKGVAYWGKAIASQAKNIPSVIKQTAQGKSTKEILKSPQGRKVYNRSIGLYRSTGQKAAAKNLVDTRRNMKETVSLNELRKDTLANYVVKRFGLGIMPSKGGGYLVPNIGTIRVGSKKISSKKMNAKIRGAQTNASRAVKRLSPSLNGERLSKQHLEPAAIRNGMLDKDYWKFSKEYIRGKYKKQK